MGFFDWFKRKKKEKYNETVFNTSTFDDTVKRIFTISKTSGQLYLPSLYDTDTPHDIMRQCLNIYLNRPMIASAINELALLITGGELLVKAKNPKVKKLIEKHINYLIDPNEITLLVKMFLITGNVPIELIRHPKTKRVISFKVFRNPSIFYLNDGAYIRDENKEQPFVPNENEWWIIEVSPNIKGLLIDGKFVERRYFTIYYSPFNIAPRKFIMGVPVPKYKFYYLQDDFGLWGYYANGLLSFVRKNSEIIEYILENIKKIAKDRSLGQLIIGLFDENGNILSEEEKERIRRALQSKEDIVIVDRKFDVKDVSFVGKHETLVNELDWLRKDIMTLLIPTVLTAWNNEVNRSTAKEVLLVFEKELDAMRQKILKFFNQFLKKELMLHYGIDEEFEFTFKSIPLLPLDELLDTYKPLYDAGIINEEQLIELLGLENLKIEMQRKKEQDDKKDTNDSKTTTEIEDSKNETNDELNDDLEQEMHKLKTTLFRESIQPVFEKEKTWKKFLKRW